MPRHNLQESLQPLPSMLNHIIRKPIREYLPRQRRDRDPRRLPLEYIPEVLEIGVSAPYDGMFQFECGDVGSADDFVGRVHVAGGAVRLGVSDLFFHFMG